jgi:hypothetical protein
MSQVTTPTEPGWLPDPSGRYEWRYWDGGWTNRVANSAPSAPDVQPAAVPEPPPAPVQSEPLAPTAEDAAPTAPQGTTEVTPAPPLTARDAVPRVPFGTESAPAPDAPAPTIRERRSPWAVVVGFFRSFADEPESYHSPLAREPLPADPRGERMLGTAPGNYGHAAIVAFAAWAIVVGAYLPWISGTIGGIAPFERTGFDEGLGIGYSIGAMSLAVSALLSVRMRIFRWLTVIVSFVVAGFVVRDLLDSFDRMQEMNRSSSVDANMGWGLWIMIVAAAIAMFAAVRLSEDQRVG